MIRWNTPASYQGATSWLPARRPVFPPKQTVPSLIIHARDLSIPQYRVTSKAPHIIGTDYLGVVYLISRRALRGIEGLREAATAFWQPALRCLEESFETNDDLFIECGEQYAVCENHVDSRWTWSRWRMAII